MHGDNVTIYDTGQLDAEFRVFTYPATTVDGYAVTQSMAALITAGITTSLAGWTDPDTGKPDDWTEITSRTNWAGNFKTQLRGSSIEWEATLSGENYDDTLLGLGCPVVMWRRYGLPLTVNPTVISGPFESYTGTADDGTTDTFTDWTSEVADSNNIIDATATVYSGTRAVKITLDSSGYADIWRAATVTGNRDHGLTFYARGTTSAKAGAIVMDAADDAVLASSVTAVTTDWQHITLNFTTPSTCTSVNIVLSPDVAGTVYYDAVNLNMYNPWSMEPWERQFVGQFVANDYADDYRRGQQWRRSVAGIGYNIGRKNASRMVFGPFDVMQGATVTVKDDDTLSDVALESDKSEFYGGLANVAESNMVDGKLNTVWISDSTPLIADDFYDPGEGRIIYPSGENGGVLVSEVFFAPPGGQNPDTAWWVEVYNYRAWGGITDVKGFYVTIGSNPTHATEYTQAMTVCFRMPEQYVLTTGRFGIICGSRTVFENMTGGAPRAQWVFDVSTIATNSFSVPPLDQTDGFVTAGTAIADMLIWSPSGAARKVQLNDYCGHNCQWHGGSPTYPAVAAFDVDGVSATSGYSIRRKADDYMEGDADAAHFEINEYPSPGAHSSDRNGVSMIVELPENTDYLQAKITSASTSVELKNGTLITLPSGSIYVDGGDTFQYTGRTGNILTGVTGISSDHLADTQIWNYGTFNQFGTSPSDTPSYALQTGYPIDAFGWRRRKTPVPTHWQLYHSYLSNGVIGGTVIEYQESGWRNTWYAQWSSVGEHPKDGLSWDITFQNNSQAWTWIRCFLLVIDQMSNLGRAKINELTARVARTGGAFDAGVSSGSTEFDDYDVVLDESTSTYVFYYLLHDYMGMAADDLDISGVTIIEHKLAEFAIGLRPLSEVLDDLARMTGCLFYPSPSGVVYWLDDKRWPCTVGMPDAYITSADIRGELQYSDNATACDYIILNVAIPFKDTVLHERLLVPSAAGDQTEPASGLQGEELDGYAIGSRPLAWMLAERFYWERQNDGSASFTAKAATALRAGQLISVTYDWDGSGSEVARRYMVDEVEEVRSLAGRNRKLDYRVSLRRYYW